MAEIQPIRALRYDLDRTGGLQNVVAPPYDVIDESPARRARGALALQRRAHRPSAGWRGPLRPRGGAAAAVARRRRCRARREPRTVDAVSGLRRTRRSAAHPPRCLRARARRGVRPRPHPPPRAHPSRPARGSAAAHARDQGQPLPHLLAVLRSRRARSPTRWAAPPAARRGPRRPTTTAPSIAWAASTTRRRSPPCRRCWRAPSCSSPTATTAMRPPASTPRRSAATGLTATC